MDRLSMCEMTTYRWSFEEDVAHYMEHGIPAIGVWRQKLSDYGEEKGKELLIESGLAVSNCFFAGGFTGSEGHSFRESIRDGLEAIHLAATIGAQNLLIFTGSRCGHTHSHAERLVYQALRRLVPFAEEHGITLVLQPVHESCAPEWTFITDLDMAQRLVEKIDRPCVKIAFDTYYWGQDPDVLETIGRLGDQIGLVQLADTAASPNDEQRRCRLGTGKVPLKEIIEALDAAGYNGFYEVALMGGDFAPDEYEDLLSQTKRWYEELLHKIRR